MVCQAYCGSFDQLKHVENILISNGILHEKINNINLAMDNEDEEFDYGDTMSIKTNETIMFSEWGEEAKISFPRTPEVPTTEELNVSRQWRDYIDLTKIPQIIRKQFEEIIDNNSDVFAFSQMRSDSSKRMEKQLKWIWN